MVNFQRLIWKDEISVPKPIFLPQGDFFDDLVAIWSFLVTSDVRAIGHEADWLFKELDWLFRYRKHCIVVCSRWALLNFEAELNVPG